MNHSEFGCKWLQKEVIWKTAEEFREKFWPEKTIPVNMELVVEDRLKLFIDPVHSLLDEYDMDAWLRLDLSGIVVDHDRFMEERFQNRLRFSLAHEVGHFVLHREVFEDLSFGTPGEWKNFVLELPDPEYKAFEWQANEFAGRLLVPHDSLADQILRTRDMIIENNLVEYMENDPDAVLEKISPFICKPFGVSEAVATIRARRESLWPPAL